MLKDRLLKFLNLEGVINNLTGYIETRVELLKIEVKEDVAKYMARILVILAVTFVFTFFLFFISVAIAYKLGESIGIFGGFAVVAGVYMVIMALFLVFRRKIREQVEQKLMEIIKQKESSYGDEAAE